MSEIKKRRHVVSTDMLVDLMKGHMVVLCGDPGQESVEILLERDEVTKDLDEAIHNVENYWDWS